MLTPVITLNSSPARWGALPLLKSRVQVKKMARRLRAIFYWMLDATPVGLRLVIIIDAVVIVAVPVPTGALVVLRRLFELALGKVSPISAELCVVLQERPRRGVVIFAHSEEAAEAENGICNLAAGLVEHDSFDLADLFVVGAINDSSFNLIAAYQSSRLSRLKSICCCHGVPFLGLARRRHRAERAHKTKSRTGIAFQIQI